MLPCCAQCRPRSPAATGCSGLAVHGILMGKQQVSMETGFVTWIKAAYSNLFLVNK